MKKLSNDERIAAARERNAYDQAVTAYQEAWRKVKKLKDSHGSAKFDDGIADNDQSRGIVKERSELLAEAKKELEAAKAAMDDAKPSFAKKLVEKIVQAIRPTPPPPNTLQIYALKFEAALGEPLISEAAIARLKLAVENHRSAWRDVNERYTEIAARRTFGDQVNTHSEFSSDVLGAIRTRGLDSLIQEYAAKSDAGKKRMMQVNTEALTLVTEATERFIAGGETWSAKRLQAEKDEALELGLPFVPSAALLTAQRIVAQHRIRLQNLSPSQSSPADLINFIQL
jgi:hypothetical protein